MFCFEQALCFCIGASLTIVKWALGNCDTKQFFSFTWIFVVGSMVFSYIAYKSISNAYDTKERARLLISDCLQYAQFYNKDLDIWKNFKDNKFIDVAAFHTLLESSDVLLADCEIEALIKEM